VTTYSFHGEFIFGVSPQRVNDQKMRHWDFVFSTKAGKWQKSKTSQLSISFFLASFVNAWIPECLWQ